MSQVLTLQRSSVAAPSAAGPEAEAAITGLLDGNGQPHGHVG